MPLDPNTFWFTRFTQPDFLLAVQMGLVPGFASVSKFGLNRAILTTAMHVDIWSQGGLYTFSTDQLIDTLSSSSIADVGQTIWIEGTLNSTTTGGLRTGESRGYAVLNGRNKVLIYDNPALTGTPISFLRVNRMKNMSTTAIGDMVGKLYCYEDTPIVNGVPTLLTKVRSVIEIGRDNQTQQAVYTIPPGKVGMLYDADSGILLDARKADPEYAELSIARSGTGKVFRTMKNFSVMTSANSNYQDQRTFQEPLPAMTDIKLHVHSVSVNMGLWGSFAILIVDEDKFPLDFLQSIGQPGY